MQILESTDYKLFETINGNRTISAKKVSKIKKDVDNGLNLFPYCPIVVNEANGKYQIIDGQHRFTASRELKLPIYYVIARELSIRDIARMNMNTDKWKYKDFLDCYIRLGDHNYQILKDWMTTHKTPIRLSLGLLMYAIPRSNGKDAEVFMDGRFKALHLQWATEFINQVDAMFGEYYFNRDINLLKAVHKLNKIGKWDVDVMTQKLKSHRHMMEKMTSTKTYMFKLEQIYNMRNHSRTPIL